MNFVNCPDCGTGIQVNQADAEEAVKVTCPECFLDLEVVEKNGELRIESTKGRPDTSEGYGEYD